MRPFFVVVGDSDYLNNVILLIFLEIMSMLIGRTRIGKIQINEFS